MMVNFVVVNFVMRVLRNIRYALLGLFRYPIVTRRFVFI